MMTIEDYFRELVDFLIKITKDISLPRLDDVSQVEDDPMEGYVAWLGKNYRRQSRTAYSI